MSNLFGGFNVQFYKAYHEIYPLEKGFEERARIASLYPLLVHVILFGGGYVNQIESVLQRFN